MPHRTATDAGLTIRAGTPADTERILELAKLSLGEGTMPRDRAYWEWKHHQNPFGESPVLLAEAGSELVGLRVFMRWEWTLGGRSYRAVRAVDTATHPAWQGKGIFSRLTKTLVQQMRDDGVHFIFNTPNEKSGPGYLKMGWEAVGRTDLRIRPIRPIRMAAALLRRRARSAGEEEGRTAATAFRPAADLCVNPELPTFLGACADPSSSRLGTALSAAYLRWRYAAIPGFDYFGACQFDGQEGAAVVFRYKRQGSLTELRICELLVGRGRTSLGTASRLLRDVLGAGGADYASLMAAPGTKAQDVAKRRLFLPAMRLGPILTVRELSSVGAGIDLTSRGAWRTSIGDLELF
jgi:GNAT superfamily N-acetyltransferase